VAVPVVDLPMLAGEQPSGPEAGELVVLDARESRLAVLAVETTAAAGTRSTEPEEPPPERWSFLGEAVRLAEGEAWLLDPEGLAEALGAAEVAKEE
jgi:hypothetical protein